MALSAAPKPPTADASAWRRGGESTPTVRGAGRPRGGGRGGGRPSTRGGGPTGRPTAPTTVRGGRSSDSDHQKPPHISTTPAPSGDAQATSNDTSTSRPKPSRRGSRPVPALVVDPSSPITPTASGPATAPLSAPTAAATSRRKRSQNRGKGASPITPSAPPTTDTIKEHASVAGDDKGAAVSDAPVASGTTLKPKDVPPHILGHQSAPADVTTFEARGKVDSIVERMRTNAMARPHTPSSHIDWAGDDDDSLPDLDDWGYGSKTDTEATSTPSPRDDIISPILEGSLKALPSLHTPDTQPPATAEDVAETPTVAKSLQQAMAAGGGKRSVETPADTQTTPRKEASVAAPPVPNGGSREERGKSRRGARAKTAGRSGPEATKPSSEPASKPGQPPANVVKPITGTPNAAPSSLPPKPEVVPVHPLPAKPAGVEQATTISPKVSIPASLPPKPAAACTESDKAPATVTPASVAEVAPVKKELASPVRGLSASIYAPKPPVPPSASQPTPSLVVNLPPSAPSQGSPEQRTHSRASTGNPVKTERSPPLSSFNAHAPAQYGHHSRTQSTPVHPSRGGLHNRAPQAARPVITVDALSKLMRDLGGSRRSARNARAAQAEAASSDK